MKISLIVAHGKNGQIGLDNKLLWHIPEDFAKFKKLTSGHTIIMGRNTFESLPGVLPNRHHIVITSKEIDINEGDDVSTASSVEEALENCAGQDNVWVIGGAQIYNYCIEKDLIDDYCLSEVDYDGEADTFINIDKINYENFNISEEEVFFSYKNLRGKTVPGWYFRKYTRTK
jgi:dihydrofolate reductase